MRQRLRMRALSTDASRRGLAPTMQDRVGLLDAGDGRVEDVAGAAAAPDRAPRRPGGSRCSATPSAVIRRLSANISSTRGEIAGDGADALRRRRLHPRRDRREGLRPRSPARSRPSRADIGPVEALRRAGRRDVAGLVGDPLLVDRLVDARQDAHHLAAARVDADRASRPRPSRRSTRSSSAPTGRALKA